jgi:2,3-bisphosphoglycerate-independent phosphoglycerate mutase
MEKYFTALDLELKKYPELDAKVATLQGRSFLDRDRDWARTDIAFDLMAKGKGNPVTSWEAAMNLSYTTVSTDEQLGQFVLDDSRLLSDRDGLICFHYRTDRAYQILKRIITEGYKDFSITTMISVSEEFDVNIAFPRLEVNNTLAETISKAQKTQMHITETEKFAHLTFFLNGEMEKEFPFETWKMMESNRFIKPYYSFEPSMRNFDIAKEIVSAIESDSYDFIIANFSSPDMVGHTGSYEAAVISAESVDFCLGKIYEAIKAKEKDYALLITADHGNSDIMWDYENNQPHTQHTTSPVPFILVSDLDAKLHRRETLSDIAPTVLDLMGLEKPIEMTGESLIIK